MCYFFEMKNTSELEKGGYFNGFGGKPKLEGNAKQQPVQRLICCDVNNFSPRKNYLRRSMLFISFSSLRIPFNAMM
jgi:hypothetical protein